MRRWGHGLMIASALAVGCGSSPSGGGPVGDGGADGAAMPDGGGGDASPSGGCSDLRCGLIHAYTFPDGASLPDEVGSASATSVQVSESGVGGRTAARFSAAAKDLVRLPDGMLHGLSAMTVCIWFQAGSGTLFSWKGTNNPGGALRLGYFKSSTSLTGTVPPADASAWRLECGVNGMGLTALELYVDGQKIGKDPGYPIVNDPPNPVVIGADFSGAWLTPQDHFDGAIDEVYIWNRPLSGAEVQALYALNAARFW